MPSTRSISPATRSGVGRGEVDLVDRGDDGEVVLEREVAVGERLRLDALRRVDEEQRALARGEAARHLVPEVDVAGRVDEVRTWSSQSRRTFWALIVMPRSRSRSIESRYWARMSRGSTAPVSSRMRSASVDFPWSTWATIAKARKRSSPGITAHSPRRGSGPTNRPALLA